MTATFSIPLDWGISSKKKISLSMNWYRNAHHHEKQKVKNMVSEYLLQYKLPKFNIYHLDLYISFNSAHRRDLTNYSAVANKFVLDSLVERSILTDDDYKHNISYTVHPVTRDKTKPNQITYVITEK